MKKYLVISEVSKKQGYIFKTNKLKENIGASTIIEYITEDLPKRIGEKYNMELVSVGGGNSLFLFNTEDDGKNFIKYTTSEVLSKFPGVEFFMTYVDFDDESESIIDKIDELYKKLNKKKSERKSVFKRNSYGIEEKCVTTGLAATYRSNDGLLSRESEQKREWSSIEKLKKYSKESTISNIIKKYEDKGYSFTNELEELGIEKGENSYIAIVSLDGNKMGQKIQHLKNNAKKRFNKENKKEANVKYQKELYKFSQSIKNHYEEAFCYMIDCIDKKYDKIKEKLNLKENIMPIRPIILAGDDVCFICNAKIALECVSKFVEKLNTYKVEGETLNACVGICILKRNYPFDKGYEIAETLCKSAKAKIVDCEKDTSLVDFHICQGEISSTLGEIRDKSHINKDISLNIKPLYLNDNNKINNYNNFKNEYARIENLSNESKGKVRKLRDIFPLGKEETRIFMNKYQISEEFSKKIDDYYCEFGFYKENNKEVCLYFDIIEMLDMFINLDD